MKSAWGIKIQPLPAAIGRQGTRLKDAAIAEFDIGIENL
jgi:hypothetical protein